MKVVNKVLILGPTPDIDLFRAKYKNEYKIGNWDYMSETDVYMKNEIDVLQQKYPNVVYVSMRDLLCRNGEFSCLSEVIGNNLYADGSHFSRLGSIEVVRLLKDIIQDK